VIISALSDPFILTEPGLHFYAKYVLYSCDVVIYPERQNTLRSIGFSEECLGLHYGNLHDADLGDGDKRKPEQYLARQFYFPVWGTCWESLAGACSTVPNMLSLRALLLGGNHFRAWKQNGTRANTGAWFLG
jgi:hypothetical protein